MDNFKLELEFQDESWANSASARPPRGHAPCEESQSPHLSLPTSESIHVTGNSYDHSCLSPPLNYQPVKPGKDVGHHGDALPFFMWLNLIQAKLTSRQCRSAVNRQRPLVAIMWSHAHGTALRTFRTIRSRLATIMDRLSADRSQSFPFPPLPLVSMLCSSPLIISVTGVLVVGCAGLPWLPPWTLGSTWRFPHQAPTPQPHHGNEVNAWLFIPVVAYDQPYLSFTSKVINFRIPLQPHQKYYIMYCTVWRTWLFIVYSDERWIHYQFCVLQGSQYEEDLDEEIAVQQILRGMLDKKVVETNILSDLGFEDRKRKDPRPKMELRHQQVGTKWWCREVIAAGLSVY